MANPEPSNRRAKAVGAVAGALIVGGLLLLGGPLLEDDDPAPAAAADGTSPTTIESGDTPDDPEAPGDTSDANTTEPPPGEPEPTDGAGTPVPPVVFPVEVPLSALGRDWRPTAAGAAAFVGGREVRFDVSADTKLRSCFLVPKPDDTLVFTGNFKQAESQHDGLFMSIGDNAEGTIIGGVAGGGEGGEEWDFGGSGSIGFSADWADPSKKQILIVTGKWGGIATENRSSEQRAAYVVVLCLYVSRDADISPFDNFEEFSEGLVQTLQFLANA